jgi:hypothetical protein
LSHFSWCEDPRFFASALDQEYEDHVVYCTTCNDCGGILGYQTMWNDGRDEEANEKQQSEQNERAMGYENTYQSKRAKTPKYPADFKRLPIIATALSVAIIAIMAIMAIKRRRDKK